MFIVSPESLWKVELDDKVTALDIKTLLDNDSRNDCVSFSASEPENRSGILSLLT